MRDSNPRSRNQNPLPYHLANPHCDLTINELGVIIADCVVHFQILNKEQTPMISIYFSNKTNPEVKKLDSPKSGCWIVVTEPSDDELRHLVDVYGLDEDLLNDAVDVYEVPRVERENNDIYIYTRYCHPVGRDIATEPLLIVHTPKYVLTIQRSSTDLLTSMYSKNYTTLTSLRTQIVLQILQTVVNSYNGYMNKVSRRILAIRAQMSKTELKNEDFIEFIDLEEDLNEFLSALQPQEIMLRNLRRGKFLQLYEDDEDLVEDLSLSTTELINLIQSRQKTIANTREAYATIAANSLNKTFKKLTSISIFMTIPTIIGGLYGMNLALPLSGNPNAFWLILGIVVAVTGLWVLLFKKLRLL